MKDKVYAQIYQTKDYDKFSFLEDNRQVRDARVKKIKDSIDEVGFLNQPLLVNEKFQIIDGQGRFNACKDLGLPIIYTIQDGLGIKECRWLNLGQENWKTWDWINSYADGGNVDYQRFRTFVNNSELSLHFITPLAFNNYAHGMQHDKAIKNGELKFSKEDAEKARWIVDYLTLYIPVKKKLKGRGDSWFGALIYAYKNMNTQQRNRLFEVIRKNVLFMECHHTIDKNLKAFDELFNKGLRKDNQIHLELLYRTEQI